MADGPYRILIRDLVLPARIGAFAHEEGAPQRVRIAATIEVVPDPTVGADRLERVVSYGPIVDAIRLLVGEGHIRLAETLAERIAAICLDDPRARAAEVTVEKLDVYPDVVVGVSVRRTRDEFHPAP